MGQPDDGLRHRRRKQGEVTVEALRRIACYTTLRLKPDLPEAHNNYFILVRGWGMT